MGNLNFGQALELMKQGKRLQRKGWNGKGMFVYYVSGGDYKVQMEAIKPYGNDENKVKYNPYFAIKNVDDSISTWVPSVNDCLAEDWQEFSTKENLDSSYNKGGAKLSRNMWGGQSVLFLKKDKRLDVDMAELKVVLYGEGVITDKAIYLLTKADTKHLIEELIKLNNEME